MSEKLIKKITPAFKDYLWGGTKLKTDFNKSSDLDIIAESWEVSTHKDGLSLIDGVSLNQYLKENPSILGTKSKDGNLPILIKYIDASKFLSIQVHPDDDYAHAYENDNGKTEMWYVVDCEEGAYLYAGVNQKVTKTELLEKIEDGTVLDVLNKVYVKKGDVIFIEPGTIHAIGSGIVIYEIQQQSNVTYRLFDFNRKDANGNTRELHLDKSIEVSNLNPTIWNFKEDSILVKNDTQTVKKLRECKYFKIFLYEISESIKMNVTSESCVFISLIQGEGVLKGENTVNLVKGDTVIIPAGSGEVEFIGNGTYLYATL